MKGCEVWGPEISKGRVNTKRRPTQKHHLPMQKLEKITPSKSSALKAPVISFRAF
jgi:hypothetical protein